MDVICFNQAKEINNGPGPEYCIEIWSPQFQWKLALARLKSCFCNPRRLLTEGLQVRILPEGQTLFTQLFLVEPSDSN